MKNFLSLILITVLMQGSLHAQDFALLNPTMNPNPGIFPGGTETVSFNLSTSQAYTFSANPASNNYATVTFSFTKLNPTGAGPSGTGANLFTWTLTNNGGAGVNLVYTWTGATKNITMLGVPNSYNILFTNVPITLELQAETDVRVAGQFTDPGNAPTGNTGNNSAVISTYTTAGGPLPIRLLTFNGVKDESKVQLQWQTSSEQNSKLFDVEFSDNSSQWVSIGTVSAAGTSNSNRNYGLVHNSPVDGVNYYRLKQVDVNGVFTYSNVVAINFTIKGVKVSSVFPNPFVSQLRIKVSSDRSEVVRIQLSDNSGRILKIQNTSIQKGINDISLDNLSGLAAGVYNVEVKTATTTYRYKLNK